MQTFNYTQTHLSNEILLFKKKKSTISRERFCNFAKFFKFVMFVVKCITNIKLPGISSIILYYTSSNISPSKNIHKIDIVLISSRMCSIKIIVYYSIMSIMIYYTYNAIQVFETSILLRRKDGRRLLQ